MELSIVQSLEGSPRPANLFEPHMPGVDVLSDMDALFAQARRPSASGGLVMEPGAPGQRAIAIVTPGRLVQYLPCPSPGTMPKAQVAPIEDAIPSDPPRRISVISYTLLEAFEEDKSRTKCIPFLGYLMGFGYIGHSVVVFEGHPSAFESGVRDSDVLLVDSGMLPFLQKDWPQVARRAMHPGARMYVYDRPTSEQIPAIPSDRGEGWAPGEPDGEASYANALLTVLGKGKHPPPARLISGRALPDLAELNTNPHEALWVSELPFRYDRLDADLVIRILLRFAGWRWYHFFKTRDVFHAKLATASGDLQSVSFALDLTKDGEGKRQLQIEKIER